MGGFAYFKKQMKGIYIENLFKILKQLIFLPLSRSLCMLRSKFFQKPTVLYCPLSPIPEVETMQYFVLSVIYILIKSVI
jgi:hypothetical protein